MEMVKLPALEKAEVLYLLEALDHHCAYMRARHHKDVGRYEELAELLRGRVKSAGAHKSPVPRVRVASGS